MSFLWDAVKDTAKMLGNQAGKATVQTKLKTEIVLLERQVVARQQAFGVELYDHVAPLTTSPDFFAANDVLTETLRPALLQAQREIAAKQIKVNVSHSQQVQAKAERAAAFDASNQPKEKTWGDVIVNGAKSTAMATHEAKLKTDEHLLNVEIQHYKGEFGVQLYQEFAQLEDSKGWIPTNREIRSIYDSCRKDIEDILKRKQEKEQAILAAGEEASSYDGPQPQQQPNGLNTTPYGQQQVQQMPRMAPQRQLQEPSAIVNAVYGQNNSMVTTIAPEAPVAPAPVVAPVAAPSNGYGSTGFSDAPQQMPQQPVMPQPVDPFAPTSNSAVDPFAPAPAVPGMFSYPQETAAPAGNGMFSYPTSQPMGQQPPPQPMAAAPVDPFAGNDLTQSSAPPPPVANLAAAFSTNHDDPFAGL